MTLPQLNTWQAIQNEVLRRIHARIWPPGHIIPNEVDLTEEFGCARATVNRALRQLAEDGILERRRKAGTRVALHPVSRATFDIPLIRQEIEQSGAEYQYSLLARKADIAAEAMQRHGSASNLYIQAVHYASGAPFVIENRWISLETVPDAKSQGFSEQSPNEWLLANTPYTHGEISFSAVATTREEADILKSPQNTPVFAVDRTTWDHHRVVTMVRLLYAPGYKLHTRIGP